MDRLETLEAVAAGKLTLTQAGAQLGLSEADVSQQLGMLELAGALSRRQLQSMKRRVATVVAGFGVIAALSSAVWLSYPAWAAGGCASTLPVGLVMMCPNSPAVASEVNGNFQQVANWIIAKTGPLASTNLTANAVTATSVSSTGSISSGSGVTANQKIRGKASVATQGFEFDWNKSGAIGETDFVNFPDQGSGGFTFYNGATNLMSLDNNGNLTLTAINGRRPIFVATNSCGTASCTASCGVGVVKMGWGFHGANGNTNIGGSYVCGTAIQWLGACIGQQSCTVTTGCGSSSLYLECW